MDKLLFLTLGMDRNGNKILKCHANSGKGFNVQTNGNLPTTHRDGIVEETWAELKEYVAKHGTKRQKNMM